MPHMTQKRVGLRLQDGIKEMYCIRHILWDALYILSSRANNDSETQRMRFSGVNEVSVEMGYSHLITVNLEEMAPEVEQPCCRRSSRRLPYCYCLLSCYVITTHPLNDDARLKRSRRWKCLISACLGTEPRLCRDLWLASCALKISVLPARRGSKE